MDDLFYTKRVQVWILKLKTGIVVMKTVDAGASGQGMSVVRQQSHPKPTPRISAKYALAVLMLLCACLLWGFGNVAQKIALQDVSPLALLFIRSLVALICLLPFAVHEYRSKKITLKNIRESGHWLAITAASFALGLACQTYGGQFTSATNLGFIINLCVLFTPLILFLGVGERISKLTLLSCVICFCGAVLLTGIHMQMPNFGDGLCLIGAVFYAVWIISLDRTLKVIDAPILVTVMQFAPTILLGFIVAAPAGELYTLDFQATWPALLFVSVLSTCVSFLMASYAQRLVEPVIAGLIYSFEALFGAYGAWLFLGETLTPLALLGGGLMFASIVMCQYCASRKPAASAWNASARTT
jgi:drug/metabolite transporter (DMT)-like permease